MVPEWRKASSTDRYIKSIVNKAKKHGTPLNWETSKINKKHITVNEAMKLAEENGKTKKYPEYDDKYELQILDLAAQKYFENNPVYRS